MSNQFRVLAQNEIGGADENRWNYPAGGVKAAGQRMAQLFMAGVLLAALSLACAPDCAFADEQTDSAATEVYLAPAADGQEGTQSNAITSKTDDAAPMVPLVAGAAVAATAAIVAGRLAFSKDCEGGRR